MASQKLHFVLLPLMAPGHMNPMVDIARLLSSRGGVTVTIVTTPVNAARISKTIRKSCLQIRIIQIPFPCAAAGLPERCENLDMLPSLNSLASFLIAAEMLQEPLENLLAEMEPRPGCIISDYSFWWTNQVAHRFRIPRIVFHGTGIFPLYCASVLMKSGILDSVRSDSEYFVVPGLPQRIELTKAQLPGFVNSSLSGTNSMNGKMKVAGEEAYGLVANTFQELEKDYIPEFKKVRKNQKVWCIGPVSACNTDNSDKAERGHDQVSIDQHECLTWLDSWESESVVYVCLGSLSRLSTAQMIEIALGLEASGKPFIWAMRQKTGHLEKWIQEEEFEQRIKNRGVLIYGWAPQVLILSHRAIGAFLTHCGWNSTIEGISSGVPLITWPVSAEQFCNEKLIVNVLEVGVRAGVEIPVRFGEEEKVGVQVNMDQIKNVIQGLMSDEVIRERARKLEIQAKMAMEEGGSSHLDLTLLIEDIMGYVSRGFVSKCHVGLLDS